MTIKRFVNIQLKRLERTNNKFIIDYIKILEKKHNNKIKEANNKLLNHISNIFGTITLGIIITDVYLRNK
jgi:hypothetical protein